MNRLGFPIRCLALMLPALVFGQNNAMDDCRRQASIATDAAVSDINVREDSGSNRNNRIMYSWEARMPNGRSVTGICEANRNGRIVRFEQGNNRRGNNNQRGNNDNQRGNGNNGRGDGFDGSFGNGNGGDVQRITANVSGKSGSGKCTFEVEVDGVAEVEIQGNQGILRTISGTTATWRRLDCNQAMPNNPSGFRFKGIDGRGSQTMVQGGRGFGVVRIEDSKNGREGYTGDFLWN